MKEDTVDTCFYTNGDKHKCCTHKYYCIFNDNRWILETELTKSWKKYNELTIQYNSYHTGCYTGDIDYNYLLRQMNLVKRKIIRLTNFRKKILTKGVKGYGYEQLEFTRVSSKT